MAPSTVMAMGITAAAGSFGQFLMVPVASLLLHNTDWSSALLILAVTALLIGPLAFGLRENRFKAGTSSAPGAGHADANAPQQTAAQALKEAFGHRDYLLLTAGYFVCGFQLAFIGVHLPSYLKDHQLAPDVATTALALIGLFNVLGSYTAGALGARMRKNWILSSIYGLRALSMPLFILAPLSAWSVSLFAAAMGTLWLSTVPPTNAIVAQIFGVAHLSMLGGIVFFSHQVGSFMGVWLGGLLYDRTGSYDIVWYISIALGVFAAMVNWPVREAPIQRGPTRVAGAAA